MLVTGGAGFVGATLVRRLVARATGCACSTTSPPGTRRTCPAWTRAGEGDIRDAATLDDALAGLGAVIHLAAAGSVVGSVADPAANFEANVVGTFRVLDAARGTGCRGWCWPRPAARSSATRCRRSTSGRCQAAVPVRRVQAGGRGVRARVREDLRAAHGSGAVRQRVRAVVRPQARRAQRVLRGAAVRRAAGDLRRRHGVARLRARRTSPPRCSSPWRTPTFRAARCCTPPRAWRPRSPRSPTCAAGPPGAPATRSSTARPGRARRAELRLLRPRSPAARLLPHGAHRGRRTAALAVVQVRGLPRLTAFTN